MALTEKEQADAHQKRMKNQKEKIDKNIAAADEERGVVILLTGNGKGKSSSAFGMIMRSMGYDYRVAVVQFIKGTQLSGEELYLRERLPEGDFYQMGTGFTWDTQDRSADIEAAKRTWDVAERLLKDETVHLLLLDELTYMFGYKYLDEKRVLDAIRNRPANQSVIVTGRGGGSALQELADTVSEIKEIKHAYRSGIQARRGVDF